MTGKKRSGRSRGAYAQTERVLELLATLRARRTPIRLDDLAAGVGVSVKQVRRDLAALGAVGHVTELVRLDGRSAVRLVHAKTEAIPLTLRERFVLLAMRDVFASLEGTPLAEDARSIFDKVAATLPDELAADLAALGPTFLYIPDGGIKSYAKHADVVDDLLTGALRRQAVDAAYTPAHGKKIAGRFEPWGIAVYRNGLYVVGRWAHEPGPRVFAVERFTRAERWRGARFDVPADFSLGSFFGGAFGVFPGGPAEKIVLEFERGVAEIVSSRSYHASQHTEPARGGRVRMTIERAITPEVVSWLTGWGPMARVVAPAALADRVEQEHRRALRTPGAIKSRSSRP